MIKKFIGYHLDFLGFSASTLCAVHCALVPVLIGFGALGSFSWLADHSIDYTIIAASLLIAFWALHTGYKKYHGNLKAIRIAFWGFLLLIGSFFLPHKYEFFLTVPGGLLVAYAHYLNFKLLQSSYRVLAPQKRLKKAS